MKLVLQRVSKATVTVAGAVVGSIGDEENGTGILAFLGVEQGDTEKDATYLAQKTSELRMFADETGKMNKSVLEVGGDILVVSQFTLLADWRKGRRPSFIKAAPPAEGERLYVFFVSELQKLGLKVQTGQFGAYMQVSLVNDGPVTFILENQFADGTMA